MPPVPTLIDTLFVVAAINPRDQYHEQAAELARKFDRQPLLVTEAVLLEIGNALARGFKRQAVEVIDNFYASPEVEVVPLTPALFERSFELYRSHEDKEWGLVDCISFVTMRERGLTRALTFDQHFVQAGFVALLR